MRLLFLSSGSSKEKLKKGLNMEIIIGLLFIILFLVYNFTKDMKEKNTELASQGGVKNKYRGLISNFDNFDTSHLPQVLNNDVNFYQMGWAGATTIASVSIFEISDKVFIEFELDYNKAALNRNGIEPNSLPPIYKKEKWSYNTAMSQDEIYSSVSRKIENLCNI